MKSLHLRFQYISFITWEFKIIANEFYVHYFKMSFPAEEYSITILYNEPIQ